MVAVAWTALGILAAAFFGMFGALFAVHGSLGGRIDRLSERVEGLAGRIDAHLERHAGSPPR